MMPPSDQEGWTHSDQLELPRQSLGSDEIEAFLLFLFGRVSRKPGRLKLKQTAAVARYLQAVAMEMPGSPERAAVDELAQVIWRNLLNLGEVQIATKSDTIGFLKQHADTYLSAFHIEDFVKQINERPEPTRQREFFRPPRLMGGGRTYQRGEARLQDDLTERIYGGYHTLRRAGVKNVRNLIAKALNDSGLRNMMGQKWGAQEVIERVNQCEDRIVRRHHLRRLPRTDRANEIERLRNMLVDDWIQQFRLQLPRRSTQA